MQPFNIENFCGKLVLADIISDLLKKYSKFFTKEELGYIQQTISRSYIPWIFKIFEEEILNSKLRILTELGMHIEDLEDALKIHPEGYSSYTEEDLNLYNSKYTLSKYDLQDIQDIEEDILQNLDIRDFTILSEKFKKIMLQVIGGVKERFLEDLLTVNSYLTIFDEHKQFLRENHISININDYRNFYDLQEMIRENMFNITDWTEAFDIEQLRNSVPVAFEDENWIIFTPQTEEQACEVGKNTDWCTAREPNPDEEEDAIEYGLFYDEVIAEWREPETEEEIYWATEFWAGREPNNRFHMYYSKTNPIYTLINKNDKRRWQYDKESGYFNLESDRQINFNKFLQVYSNQLSEELLQFLNETSGQEVFNIKNKLYN